MLPSPPHCATRRPPGRSTVARFANSASWSDTQWKVAVDRTASTEAGSRGSGCPRSATTNETRSPNGASRPRATSTIDGEASSATTRPRGSALEELLRDPPGAASGIEHGLVAGQRQAVEDVGAPARHRVGDAVVGRAVPVAGSAGVGGRRHPQPIPAASAGPGAFAAVTSPSPGFGRSPIPFAAAPPRRRSAAHDRREPQRIDRRLLGRRNELRRRSLARRVERLDQGTLRGIVRIERRDGQASPRRRTSPTPPRR